MHPSPRSTRAWLSALLASVAATAAQATDDPAPLPVFSLERIVITATRLDASKVGGSAALLDAVELETHAYADVNRALRQVPGLNIVEEEGFGIRPNIGIRGSGTDRNAKIAVMEDGVPIAPAPYAAPAAYYFPRLPRMAAIEVTKGPAAIKYGPQTVAGAIGMLSAPIPEVVDGLGGKLQLFGGDFGTWRGHAQVGGYIETGRAFDIGLSLETLQEHSDGFKDLDSGGDTGFRIGDYVAKLALRSAAGAERQQLLELKFQYSDEASDETYLGLSLDDFRADPYRRYRASQLDQIDVEHRTYQATHRIDFSERVDLTTLAYRTETVRAWYKLNDLRNAADTGFTSLSNVLNNPSAFPVEYAALIGAPGDTSAAGALRVRNNNRAYQAEGVQAVLGYAFDSGPVSHQLELSARFHRDEEDRFQQDDRYQMVDGLMVLNSAGVSGTQDNRLGTAEAWSFYLRDTLAWQRLTVSPGLRYESISLRQTNWGGGDPGRSGSPTPARSTVDVLLPGIGATYVLNDSLTLLGGVHRGFVNPAPGSTADAEESWNYEAGLRVARGAASVSAVAFLVDYENLVGTCTASTGGSCNIGDQFDGGKTRVHGLELVTAWDAAAVLDTRLSIPLSAVYTWTHGEFQSSFASGFSEWGIVVDGDRLPLVPEHQLTLNAGLEGDRWRLSAAVNYVDEARSRAGSGPIPAAQLIDSRTLVDLSGEYELRAGLHLFGSVTNLSDEVYNVGFRPSGARPGAPRSWLLGVKLAF